MHKTRQHHYVQARYLDGFLVPPSDKLWCYGRRRPEPYQAVPDKLARQRDFYQLPDAPLGINLESFLEKVVEAPGLAALRQLTKKRQLLDVEARIHLARYIAFQEMRVPHTRELHREQVSRLIQHMLQQFEGSDQTTARLQNVALVEGVEGKRSEPVPITREQIEEYAKEIASNPTSFDLNKHGRRANDTARFSAAMRWTVFLARDTAAFITSDCPVFRMYTEPGGDDALLRPDCMVCCPLSARALLVMEHDIDYLILSMKENTEGNGHTLPPTHFRIIKDKEVRRFNRRIVEFTDPWCFSGNRQEWITNFMQRPSKRMGPSYIEHGAFYGVRWRRSL